MADQITNYQCPACTGPLHYVGASGKLECDYCGSKFDVSEIEALYAEKEDKAEEAMRQAREQAGDGWDESELCGDWGKDADSMRAYNCPSCGAQLICDEHTAATACPYCGNPTVVPGNFSGALKPDFVIPFRLDREQAQEALRKFYKGKRLLPKDFAAENKISEVKGVYVPFWMFDGKADVKVEFDAEKIEVTRDDDYETTSTHHYDVRREGMVDFEKIPVDASTKMPDEYMDAIEPFDYGELKPFSTAYLPGFLADRYDVTAKESTARADERAGNTAVAAMESDVLGYDSHRIVSKFVKLHRGKVHYALLPVYLLNTRWKDKDYLFAINGQTGQLAGNLPVSRAKWWAWFGGITAAITAVLGTIIYFVT